MLDTARTMHERLSPILCGRCGHPVAHLNKRIVGAEAGGMCTRCTRDAVTGKPLTSISENDRVKVGDGTVATGKNPVSFPGSSSFHTYATQTLTNTAGGGGTIGYALFYKATRLADHNAMGL